MNRNIGMWQLFGFSFTSLFGTLLHFLYDWLGEPLWIAPFSGVNESTFEHMKLFFWPMLVFTVIQSFFFKSYENFLCVKLRGMLLGLSLIPIIFYTYNGVIGKSPDWVNIAIFFISAAIVYIYEARMLKSGEPAAHSVKAAALSLAMLAAIFIVFTFRAPHLGIFIDPLTGKYGIS